jgi:hypothetical protein
MRIAIMTIVAVALAVPALADTPDQLQLPITGPEYTPKENEWYCQLPDALAIINASSGFGAELADDIPTMYASYDIYELDIIVGQWSTGAWSDPLGITVSFYNGQCPPDLTAYHSQYHAWADLGPIVYYDGDPGYPWAAYWVTIYKCPPIHIEPTTSLGIQVDTQWGTGPPYTGCWVTYYSTYGACGGYWDGTYWGAPRWYPCISYFGYPGDLVYCLGDESPVGTDEASWSSIKTLFK